jgi:hypothetical protein
MKKTFSKTAAWLKSLAVSVWKAAEYVEIPSSSDWADFKKYKQLNDSSIAALVEALVTVPLVILASWIRLLVPTVYALIVIVLIAGGLLWKLATFWKDAK